MILRPCLWRSLLLGDLPARVRWPLMLATALVAVLAFHGVYHLVYHPIAMLMAVCSVAVWVGRPWEAVLVLVISLAFAVFVVAHYPAFVFELAVFSLIKTIHIVGVTLLRALISRQEATIIP